MELTRTELMPGVWLSHLRSDKFKTAFLSLNLLTQLKRETAAMNALIPFVLRRGTSALPDLEAISARLDELYGVAIEPVIRRVGEIQCLGFYASFPEEDLLPSRQEILRPTAALLGQFLLSPATRGGLLLPAYVDSEREKMLELLRGRINEKRSYSVIRCTEEMCCCEDYAVGRYGSVEECEAIRYKKLTQQYHALLQNCPIELFYCGRAEHELVEEALLDALTTLPRGEIDYDIGTDVRMNAMEAEPREVVEKLDVTQGKLVIGFRLGECMEEPNEPALYVFNTVFGSGTSSKLFMNVRERLQLCYYASSLMDVRKGLMWVASGIDFDKKEAAQAEILAQLEAIRRGEISDEELDAARQGVASDLRMLEDGQSELEGFTLSQVLQGSDCGPMEMAQLSEEVTREEVVAIANSVECDLIYFLCGDPEAAEEEADDDTEA